MRYMTSRGNDLADTLNDMLGQRGRGHSLYRRGVGVQPMEQQNAEPNRGAGSMPSGGGARTESEQPTDYSQYSGLLKALDKVKGWKGTDDAGSAYSYAVAPDGSLVAAPGAVAPGALTPEVAQANAAYLGAMADAGVTPEMMAAAGNAGPLADSLLAQQAAMQAGTSSLFAPAGTAAATNAALDATGSIGMGAMGASDVAGALGAGAGQAVNTGLMGALGAGAGTGAAEGALGLGAMGAADMAGALGTAGALGATGAGAAGAGAAGAAAGTAAAAAPALASLGPIGAGIGAAAALYGLGKSAGWF